MVCVLADSFSILQDQAQRSATCLTEAQSLGLQQRATCAQFTHHQLLTMPLGAWRRALVICAVLPGPWFI